MAQWVKRKGLASKLDDLSSIPQLPKEKLTPESCPLTYTSGIYIYMKEKKGKWWWVDSAGLTHTECQPEDHKHFFCSAALEVAGQLLLKNQTRELHLPIPVFSPKIFRLPT